MLKKIFWSQIYFHVTIITTNLCCLSCNSFEDFFRKQNFRSKKKLISFSLWKHMQCIFSINFINQFVWKAFYCMDVNPSPSVSSDREDKMVKCLKTCLWNPETYTRLIVHKSNAQFGLVMWVRNIFILG